MTIEWNVGPQDEAWQRIPRSVWAEAEIVMVDRIRRFIAEQDITIVQGSKSYTIVNPDMEKVDVSFSYGYPAP